MMAVLGNVVLVVLLVLLFISVTTDLLVFLTSFVLVFLLTGHSWWFGSEDPGVRRD
jgi:hypothetical protein